jgi:hypothetical protein
LKGIFILAFANSSTTPLVLVYEDAGLDRNAARNIIDYPDRASNTPGTADNYLFGSMKEPDSGKYAGDSATNKMRDYVATR